MTDSLKSRTNERVAVSVPDPAAAVFAEPWEARAFALALTLSAGGQFSWDEFRDHLIAEIAKAGAAGVHHHGAAAVLDNHPASDSPRGPYYECWLAALEKLLREKALLNGEEIERRADAITASPPAPTKSPGRGPIKIA
jgi:nitrile hydratase accessory protein